MTEQVANLNIQEDVLSLRIENKALREVIIDLEEQIEKMKCCDNCDYFVSKKEGWVCEKGSIYQFCIGKTCTDWKLKE